MTQFNISSYSSSTADTLPLLSRWTNLPLVLFYRFIIVFNGPHHPHHHLTLPHTPITQIEHSSNTYFLVYLGKTLLICRSVDGYPRQLRSVITKLFEAIKTHVRRIYDLNNSPVARNCIQRKKKKRNNNSINWTRFHHHHHRSRTI